METKPVQRAILLVTIITIIVIIITPTLTTTVIITTTTTIIISIITFSYLCEETVAVFAGKHFGIADDPPVQGP